MVRRQRIRIELDTGEITELQPEEIRAILRAADELIAAAGRSMLVKILKGSKDKKIRRCWNINWRSARPMVTTII